MLVKVMNAVAALCDPDSGLLGTSYIGLGFLIGLIMVLFKKVYTAGEQGSIFGWFLVAFIMYSVMFVPKVEVGIVDGFSGATTTVANVPMGVGVSGHIMSNIGRTLAVNFETAFATPSMTEGGFVDALEVLMNMRDLSLGPYNSGGGVVPGDVEKTIQYYISDCVIYDIEMPSGTLTWEKLRNATSLLTAMEVNATAWFTRTFMPGGSRDGDLVTCADAYSAIKNYLEDATRFAAWRDSYVGPAKLKKESPEVSIDSALADVVNTTNTSANFMLNSLLANQTRLSQLKHASDYGTAASALITTQAVDQRNVQWAAEETLFKSVARPLMTFVESFVYALTPIMAFLILLGPAGISLVGKYLMLGLWVQLWMPVMAIVNLYINMAASADFVAINAAAELTSMGMLDTLYTSAQSYVATGGMLAAAVPALTLMLLYGSSQAMTHLAGRLQGSDHVNEKLAAPDISNAPPAMNIAAGHSWNPSSGLSVTGMEGMVPTISARDTVSSATASAQTASTRATQSWQEATSRVFNKDWASGVKASHSNDSVEQVAARGTDTDRVAYSVGQTLSSGVGLKQAEQHVLNNLIGASGSGSWGTPGGEISPAAARIGIESALRNTNAFSDEQVNGIMANYDRNASHGQEWGAALERSKSSGKRDGEEMSWSTGISQKDSTALQETKQRAVDAGRSYSAVAQQSSSFDQTQSAPVTTLGQRAVANGAVRAINAALASVDGGLEKQAGNARALYSAGVLQAPQDRDQLNAAAGIQALNDLAPEKLMQILPALGFNKSDTPANTKHTDPSVAKNSDLDTNPDNLVSPASQETVQRETAAAAETASWAKGDGTPGSGGARQNALNGIGNTQDILAAKEQGVYDAHFSNVKANASHARDGVQEQLKAWTGELAAYEQRVQSSPSRTNVMNQMRETLNDNVQGFLDHVPDAIMGQETKQAVMSAFKQTITGTNPNPMPTAAPFDPSQSTERNLGAQPTTPVDNQTSPKYSSASDLDKALDDVFRQHSRK